MEDRKKVKRIRQDYWSKEQPEYNRPRRSIFSYSPPMWLMWTLAFLGCILLFNLMK